MEFTLDQHIAAPPPAVAGVFADPSFYATLGELPKLGAPEVVGHEVDDDIVRLRLRYRFTGELSSAAQALLDPAKLTWVEESTHDVANGSVSFRMVPEHYGDRFRCSGGWTYTTDGAGTLRASVVEVVVKAPFVGRAVERAIVSGLREHATGQAPLVEAFLARGGG